MIYLVIHLQNKISRLLQWNCVVMHRGHIKRENDLKFTGPINNFHQHPISGQMLLQCQHIHAWCLFLPLYPSSACLPPCHSMQLCASVHWERKKYGNRHIPGVSSDDIVLRDRAVDVTSFSKSPWRRFSPFLSTL